MERRKWILLLTATLISACTFAAVSSPDAEERGRLSTYMVNLSAAVDTYFSFLQERPMINDAEILKNATSHDQRLLTNDFEPYLIKVQYQNPYAVLLLCTKDGGRAIMEDAGCSARLDRQIADDSRCEFTLKVKDGCTVEGADGM